jgi:hypothetical protein
MPSISLQQCTLPAIRNPIPLCNVVAPPAASNWHYCQPSLCRGAGSAQAEQPHSDEPLCLAHFKIVTVAAGRLFDRVCDSAWSAVKGRCGWWG